MSSQKRSLCQVDDLPQGQMRQFTVLGRDILLGHGEGGFWATAAHCSHYGAPLEKGVLSGDRIVCPWHNACFSLRSGEMLEPPGRDHLVTYKVEIESGEVRVEIPVSEIRATSSTYIETSTTPKEHVSPAFAAPDLQQDDRVFAIVGGGAAGSAAAEMLRQQGFRGRIVMLSADRELPYDRTALSKAYLQSDTVADPDLLRSADFYRQHGVDVMLSTSVSRVDAQAQQLTYGAGEVLKYDALLVATGGAVRQLPVAGSDLANVFTLRRADDAQHILKAAQNAQRAVIIGAGFIGMEVAASLRQQGLAVTVVASSAVPFETVLGESVGQLFQQIHEAEGVQFQLKTKAKAFHGEGQVASVELDNGEQLPADVVVVGIGVKPATDFLDVALLHEGDGSVVVNEYLQAAPNLYAAGDIARFPYAMTDRATRIEHWRLALQQGRIAAHNMLGQQVPFRAVPFFWTGQFGIKLRYVGHAEDWDDVIIHGSLPDQTFLAFYTQADRVLAVAGAGRDRDIAAISELMRLEQMPSAEEIRQTDLNWIAQLAA
ncbi:MAG: FAD-dependent oxidoreductase [Nodosilinea sp.]